MFRTIGGTFNVFRKLAEGRRLSPRASVSILDSKKKRRMSGANSSE
jgi:hypothetical protein